MVGMCNDDEYPGWKESEWSTRQTGLLVIYIHMWDKYCIAQKRISEADNTLSLTFWICDRNFVNIHQCSLIVICILATALLESVN